MRRTHDSKNGILLSMKWLLVLLSVLFIGLQIPLWFGEGSLPHAWQLRSELKSQKSGNQRLLERNETLKAEVLDLKNGGDAIEERARAELGMIRKGETFYQIIENKQQALVDD